MDDGYTFRFKQVCDLQKSYGMTPRDDSILTQKYANKQIEGPPEDIAKELFCVDYIYCNTIYGEIIEEYMRCLASLIKQKYKLSWNDTWEIVKFYGPDSLKLICVTNSNIRIPLFSNI